ncbi:hypothetical protein CVT26_012165 [Gymnopilus dilepis]|uniref:Uncharacterized protein n=1 Tax=Gymnopilus dilepis TaxID=231916 RepID=A0A409X245_9AGAR|nr:hypothetical protein CVT26_012165 [Gymnopilus dilepis]
MSLEGPLSGSSSAVPRSSQRTVSPVFRRAPFLRTVLASKDDVELRELTLRRPGYATFVRRFMEYEDRLLGTTEAIPDADLQEMRDLLNIRMVSSQCAGGWSKLSPVAGPRFNWNGLQHGRLCSLMTVYHLIDVLAFVEDVGTNALAIERSSENLPIKSLPGYDCLFDWTSTVLRLQDVVEESVAFRHRPDARGSAAQSLVSFLRLNANSAVQCRLMLNLTIAAMHLAYLKETAFSSDELPDLPGQINDDMIRHVFSPLFVVCDACNAEEKAFLCDLQDVVYAIAGYRQRKANGALSLASFRGPLQAALLISPVYLLSTKLLGNKIWNRQTLMHTSAMLGNEKPISLLSVEKIIWNTLLLLADGQLDPRQTLLRLKADMPWSEVRRAADDSRVGAWFRLDLDTEIQLLELAQPPALMSSRDDAPLVHVSAVPTASSAVSNEETVPTQPFDFHALQLSNNGLGAAVTASLPSTASFDFANMNNGVDGNVASRDPDQALEKVRGRKKEPLFLDDSEENFNTSDDSVLSVPGGSHGRNRMGRPNFSATSLEGSTVPGDSLDRVAGHCSTDSERSAAEEDASYDPKDSRLAGSIEDAFDQSPSVDMNITQHDASSESAVSSKGEEVEDEDDTAMNVDFSSRDCKTLDIEPRLRRSDRLMQLQDRIQQPSSANALAVCPSYSPPRKKRKRSGHSAVLLGKGPLALSADVDESEGTESNPIDVDQFHVPSMWEPDDLNEFRLVASSPAQRDATAHQPLLTSVRKARLEVSEPFTCFGPTGSKFNLRLEYYSEAVQRRFNRLIARAAASYIDGRPLHLARPQHSVIEVMRYCDFVKLNSNDVQSIMSRKNLIVTDAPNMTSTFDRESLARIYPLHSPIHLRDYSATPELPPERKTTSQSLGSFCSSQTSEKSSEETPHVWNAAGIIAER